MLDWFRRKSPKVDLPEGLRYRAFLSYRSSDQKQAKWLHRRLEGYRVPRHLIGKIGAHGPIPARITPVFRDRDDARAAEDLETIIAENLGRSQHLIVLCTPSAAAPEAWVGREIEIFRRSRPSAAVHAVIGSGAPPQCFPSPLLVEEANGSLRAPLAADLRPTAKGGDGPSKAVVKVVAGVLGVDFDDLWRRERRRRTVQRAFAAGVAAVVIVAGSAWLRQRESTRLVAITNAAQQIDPNLNHESSDLMLIAGGPPAIGSTLRADPLQMEAVRGITRKFQSSFAAFAAYRQERPDVTKVSDDGRFAFTRGEANGLFVWDAAHDRLVTRVPIDAGDWLVVARETYGRDTPKPLALDVSADGRAIVAVYALDNTPRRTAAYWKLDERGRCPAPCRPRSFAFTMPAGALDVNGGITRSHAPAEVRWTADAHRAIYVEDMSLPHALDFASRTATMFRSFSGNAPTRCKLQMPKPPPPPEPAATDEFLEATYSIDKRIETAWFEKSARTLAKLRHGASTVAFFSGVDDRELARIDMPAPIGCIGDCPVDVMFFDAGRKAVITSTDSDFRAVTERGRIYGIVDLERCQFDAWPNDGGPHSLVTRLAPQEDSLWAVHRLEGFRMSADERYAAAVLTISAHGYRTLGVIYSLAERRAIALFDPPAADLGAMDEFEWVTASSSPEYPFLFVSPRRVVPSRVDGTPGATVSIEVGDDFTRVVRSHRPVRTVGARLLIGDRATGVTERAATIADEAARAVAVSADGRFLAVGQQHGIEVQPAGTDAIDRARRIPTSAPRDIEFSPDGTLVAALLSSYDTPGVVQVWRVATGENIGQHDIPRHAKLQSVGNDGGVAIDAENGVRTIDVRTGQSKALVTKPLMQIVRASAIGPVAASAEGPLRSIDGALQIQTTAGADAFLKDKTLLAVTPDGKRAYVSDFQGDYFLDLTTGDSKQFLRNTTTGSAAFGGNDRFAIAVALQNVNEIQLWDPVAAVKISTFRSDWGSIRTVWFSGQGGQLWALDDLGRLHRWSLNGSHVAGTVAACLALRARGARLELTESELASHGMLERSDKAPCLRAGALTAEYYKDLAWKFADLVTGNDVAYAPSDCDKRKDPEKMQRCRARFESRWKRLEKLAADQPPY